MERDQYCARRPTRGWNISFLQCSVHLGTKEWCRSWAGLKSSGLHKGTSTEVDCSNLWSTHQEDGQLSSMDDVLGPLPEVLEEYQQVFQQGGGFWHDFTRGYSLEIWWWQLVSHVTGQHDCAVLTARVSITSTYTGTRGPTCCSVSCRTTDTWSPGGYHHTVSGVFTCSVRWSHVLWGVRLSQLLHRFQGLLRLSIFRLLTPLRVHALPPLNHVWLLLFCPTRDRHPLRPCFSPFRDGHYWCSKCPSQRLHHHPWSHASCHASACGLLRG